MKNLVLSGSKNVGKSYMIQKLVENLSGEYDGFFTCHYEKEGEQGHYFHSIQDMKPNDGVIIRVAKDEIITYPDVFETIGVSCLRNANKKIIVLDELGRIEKYCETFKKSVINQFNSDKIVLCVVKKEPISWLEEIIHRKDIIFYDLDLEDWEVIYTQVKIWLMEEYEKIK